MEIKDRIKHKAEELFRRYGVKSVTMDEIASQLGMSKKTLYQSFSDKNELVDEVIEEMLADNRESCDGCRALAENAVHEVMVIMQNVQEMLLNLNPVILFDIQRSHPGAFKKFTRYKYDYLLKLVQQNIVRGINEGWYREEIDVEIISRLRVETIILPFDEEIFPRTQYSMLEIQNMLIEFYLYGLVNPRGYELIQKYKKENLKKTER